jgi:hypothetical protein
MNTNLLFNHELFKNLVFKEELLFNEKINFIEDNILKNILGQILQSRLSGNVPDFLSSDSDNYYDWEKNIDPELIDYFSDFDKYYFSNKYSDELNLDLKNLILPVIENIKMACDKIKSTALNNKDPKKLLIILYESGDKFHNEKMKVEYIFLVWKIKNFIELINLVYPNNFLFEIQDKLKNTIGFSEFISIIISSVKKSIRNYIENFSLVLNSQEKNELFKILLDTDKNIKSLFWMVYSHDIKYIDIVLRTYNLSEDYLDELLQSVESSDNPISDIYEKLFDKIELVKENFINSTKSKIKNIPDYLSLSNDELLNFIDTQIENIISNISDPDDYIITKNSLEDCKQIINLEIGLDKTIGIFSDFFKK